MKDGKGALYFVKPIHECSENFPGPPQPFFKPQATKMTRQEMRDTSPSGVIDMDAWMGRRWVIIAMKAILTICIVGLAVNALV